MSLWNVAAIIEIGSFAKPATSFLNWMLKEVHLIKGAVHKFRDFEYVESLLNPPN